MLHYIQKRINFVSISMYIKFSKFLTLPIVFAALFLILPASTDSTVRADDVPQIYGSTTNATPCPFNVSKNNNAKIAGSRSYLPDVGCVCQINQCRLSTGVHTWYGGNNTEAFEDNSFICIPSNTSAETNPPTLQAKGSSGTYGDLDITEFTDKTYWKSIIGEQNLSGTQSTTYFLDLFSSDSTKQVVPIGATCRTNANDAGGTAYWFYPGYFDIMQGKAPSGNTFTSCGNASGTNILFSNVDLFGNQVSGTQTLFGCLPNSLNGFVAFIVRLVSGLSVAIAFLIILINLVRIISSSTNPDAVAESQKKMAAAFFTLVGILLTITILSIFGLQIIGFGSEGVGGALFRFFVGG